MMYCRAVLPRAGLGNRLLPWARCRLFSLLHNAPMLSPRWAQFKVGQLLRGEHDTRFYHNLFRRRQGDITGISKTWLRVCSAETDEPETLAIVGNGTQDVVVRFEGLRDYFLQLTGWDEQLHQELRAITREHWLRTVNSITDIPIAIHVRRGDFAEPENDQELRTKGNLRTPLLWFIRCLDLIRDAAGACVRAVVVSDDNEDALEGLLVRRDVRFVRTGSAISDLLVLAKAKILVASGGSSFSAWASFLGQMPTISHPGQSMTWFKLKNRRGYYLGEFDPASPVVAFLEQAKAILS
jgi:hypothetical protein